MLNDKIKYLCILIRQFYARSEVDKYKNLIKQLFAKFC